MDKFVAFANFIIRKKNCQKQSPGGAQKNFLKFTGKHLRWNTYLQHLQPY